jgi:hypothetical protein
MESVYPGMSEVINSFEHTKKFSYSRRDKSLEYICKDIEQNYKNYEID